MTEQAIIFDKPEQVGMWYFLSAVSQLSLEIKTGQNFYGRTSAYTGIRRNYMPGFPARATVRNKLLMLAQLLEAVPNENGAVFQSARATLAAKLEELGLEISPA